MSDIIPFWFERSWDSEFGGFLTNFDRDGNSLGTPEKYLNTQCRQIWWFSALARRFPDRADFGDLAQRGLEFLIDHFWDPEFEGWYWKVQRDGTCLDDGKVVYGQSFAIYALAENYLATGNQRALELAIRTFDLLQIHCADTRYGGYLENMNRQWIAEPAGSGGGDRKGIDTHMHLMEAFTVLYEASQQEIHRRKLLELVSLIADRMIDPVSGCGRNQFDLAFTPLPAIAINRTWNAEREGETPEIPTDTTSFGHNVELVWLLRRALETANADLDPFKPALYKLLDHAANYGVDWKYGGIFRDGKADGTVLVEEKEFWQHAEALIGFLDGFEVFGEARFWSAFENIRQFVNRNFINPAVGEWYTLLDREGGVIDGNIGNPWKVAYHTGRSALECTARLTRLLQTKG